MKRKSCYMNIEKQVLLYAAQEDKKAVKSLAKYNAMEKEDPGTCLYYPFSLFCKCYVLLDRTTSYVLQLVTAMLQSRGKAKTSLFSVFEARIVSCPSTHVCWLTACLPINLEWSYKIFIYIYRVNQLILKSHFRRLTVMPCPLYSCIWCQYRFFKLVIERENIITVSSLSYALHCCFACYDISFPADSSPVMVFLEKHVYGLRPSKKLSLTASILLDTLQAFEVWLVSYITMYLAITSATVYSYCLQALLIEFFIQIETMYSAVLSEQYIHVCGACLWMTCGVL